jgi:plastocyanin
VPRAAPAGAPPAGLHLPSPSIWPLIAPIGLFLIFASVVFTGTVEVIDPTDPSRMMEVSAGPNLLLLAIGLALGALAALGWYLDAGREYAATEAGDRHLVLVEETDGREPLERPMPAGIHLPPPSAWPFLAPIGLFLAFLGLVFGPVLILGGLLMAAIAAAGWYLDAGREYREVAEGVHPDPEARDPERRFPKRLMPLYVAIAAVSIALTLAPWFLTLLPQETQATASGPTPTTTPYVSATSVLSFEQDLIVVPADTPFTITFENKQDGVPHNVAVFTDASTTDFLFVGEIITGPATIDYPMDPLPAGEYPFICSVHPPMKGVLVAK